MGRTALVLAAIAVASLQTSAAPVPPEISSRDAIERDLVLEIEQAKWDESDELPRFSLSIRNRSRRQTHLVISPTPDCIDGNFEPHVQLIARTADGVELPEKPKGHMRACGLCELEKRFQRMDRDRENPQRWTAEVIALQPGKSIAFAKWKPALKCVLPRDGSIFVFARYEFRSGLQPGENRFTRLRGEAILATPNFILESKPVTLKRK